jgi:hypothetical protein
MVKKYFTFSHFTLAVALSISAIAAWYSVIGLTAIFAGAVIPIIIMGSILEIAKITTTAWLHRYWKYAGKALKTYLTCAVVVLALLTSMGIFGLLSKAHLEQGVVGGDVQSQVALLDEKIKTQRDNIELARKALSQMDAQVEQRLIRGDSESSAERAVQIRRQQGPERTKLQNEIAAAQDIISKLNEERAPIASQLRKVTAEVGPIRYIASLVYGDNPDANTLERAVRWVTILIVLVFDPLAIILIIAAQTSIQWERKIQMQESTVSESVPVENVLPSTQSETAARSEVDLTETMPAKSDEFDITKHPYLFREVVQRHPPGIDPEPPKIWRKQHEAQVTLDTSEIDKDSAASLPDEIHAGTIEKMQYNQEQGYVHYAGKRTSIAALREMRPDLIISKNSSPMHVINYGSEFPASAIAGEFYIRTDVTPHKVYSFDSSKWVAVDKNKNTVYLQNTEYLKYLIAQVGNAYPVKLLTQTEEDKIAQYLSSN